MVLTCFFGPLMWVTIQYTHHCVVVDIIYKIASCPLKKKKFWEVLLSHLHVIKVGKRKKFERNCFLKKDKHDTETDRTVHFSFCFFFFLKEKRKELDGEKSKAANWQGLCESLSETSQCMSLSANSSLMECLRVLQSGMSKPKSGHSSAPAVVPRLGMVMVWRTRKCTASMTRCRCSSPPGPMAMVAMLLLERISCWP